MKFAVYDSTGKILYLWSSPVPLTAPDGLSLLKVDENFQGEKIDSYRIENGQLVSIEPASNVG